MYKEYYHLKAEPFSTHPNTGTFFVSETHKQAWYYLLFGIDTQEPFLVLTGDYGMGKTLLCLRLIKFLKEKGMSRVEYIPTSNEGYGGVLRRIAMGMGISPLPQDEEILQDMIYDSFRADTDKKRFYLIIDDVHELDLTFLTKLKYLSTFNHDEFFPVIMIFVGHPSFLQDLRTPALNSLNQRIKRRYNLAVFDLEDTKNYIYFRLLKSGATGIPAFPAETIQKIFTYSGGVPRLINNICDTCLLIGASKQLATIHPGVVEEAKNLVEGSLTHVDMEEQTEPLSTDETATPAPVPVTTPASAPAPVPVMTPAPPPAPISFSENLPPGGQDPVNRPASSDRPTPSARTEAPEYETPPTPPPSMISGLGKKIKKAIKITAAVVLLLLCLAAALFLYVSSDAIVSFFSTMTQSVQKEVTAKIDRTVEGPPAQLEKITEAVPTLREEATGAASNDTTAHADRNVKSTPAQPEASSRQTGAMDTPATATGGSSGVHPFSLRSASHQQLDMALQEIDEIKRMGLLPYLVKADSGPMGAVWRTYIGFYATQEEAQRIKARYKLAHATVQKTEFACHVGDFSNESEGIQIFERLKQAGYFPYVIQKERSTFRIYIGAYETRAEAEALNSELQNQGIRSRVVTR
jgi:type II secretory pathway predicted ATPase ExeA